MKMLMRNVLITSSVLYGMVIMSPVLADGRDSSYGVNSHGSVYSSPGVYVAPYSNYSIDKKWLDHGQGNWYSWFGSVESENYNGYAIGTCQAN